MDKRSVLDPFSDRFDAKLWRSRSANLEDWSQVRDRKIGVSFKDLTVFGYKTDVGEPILKTKGKRLMKSDYQKTVANLPLSWIPTARGPVYRVNTHVHSDPGRWG
jgi:hypothetical protein